MFASHNVDSVAKVEGRRTQDQEALSSNPEAWLISKGCGESLNGELRQKCDLTVS